jgi:hypothetical protein
MKLTIDLDDNEVKILRKRAKKNLLDLREQVEDIVRRSCINAGINTSNRKTDDDLVNIFSREARKKRKKKN